jgi:hypothetical protein
MGRGAVYNVKPDPAFSCTGGAEVRRCGGAEVRRCGGAEVRRCGGAEVRRCGGAFMIKGLKLRKIDF